MNPKILQNINSSFQGEVIKGNELGRKLGFPTANLDLQSKVDFPTLNGVYSVRVYYNGQQFHGVMNIGVKPTFENISRVKTFEVHIFNFNQDIYGEILNVDICNFIRSEKKFDSIAALKKQLYQDCEVAKMQLIKKNQQHHLTKKLEKYKPATIGQASRISGVSPADIAVLAIALKQGKGKKQA